MIIRQMRESDLNSVLEIYKESIDKGTITFTKELPTCKEWDNSHLKVCRLVAQIDDKVIGFVALSPYSKRDVYKGVCELSVYLLEKYTKRGIGLALINSLIESSEQHGIWTLQSNIFRTNEASIALHLKCGFRMVGYREKIGQDVNGIWRDSVILERRSKIIG